MICVTLDFVLNELHFVISKYFSNQDLELLIRSICTALLSARQQSCVDWIHTQAHTQTHPYSILTAHLCWPPSFPPPHSSPARGDHRSDRGGVHCRPSLHQQDKVRGEIYGEALPPPGKPSAGVPPQDGGDGPRAVVMSAAHFTGGTGNIGGEISTFSTGLVITLRNWRNVHF